MSGSKILKQIMIEKNISVKDLAELLSIKPQSMSNKLYRDNFTFEEMLTITKLLNCDLKIVLRDTGKEFTNN